MPTELTEQISAVEERLRLAMLVSDCKSLDDLISPDLVFTNHFGQVFGKHDDLQTHRSGALNSVLPPAPTAGFIPLSLRRSKSSPFPNLGRLRL